MIPIPNSYWVTPKRLLAGAYPGAPAAKEARRRLQAFLDAGIRSFLDLTETDELGGYESVLRDVAAAHQIDVRYKRMAVEDFGTPTVAHMSEVLQHIDSELAEGRAIYVHCWGGIGRTGTVVGCWMVHSLGLAADEALRRIDELRRNTPEWGRPSPETPQQCEFVLRWSATRNADEKV